MNYSLINKVDIVNGPGIRVSLFVSGCNRHCKNCYNKEAQNFNNGEPFNQEVYRAILEYERLHWPCATAPSQHCDRHGNKYTKTGVRYGDTYD